MKPTIYIAGPLESSGSLYGNVRKACSIADMILRFGGIPFVPHIAVQWVMCTPTAARRGVDGWLEWCLAWVERCDALYRIPGDSAGADREEKYAADLGKPIMRSVYEAAELLGYELDSKPTDPPATRGDAFGEQWPAARQYFEVDGKQPTVFDTLGLIRQSRHGRSLKGVLPGVDILLEAPSVLEAPSPPPLDIPDDREIKLQAEWTADTYGADFEVAYNDLRFELARSGGCWGTAIERVSKRYEEINRVSGTVGSAINEYWRGRDE